MHPRMQQVLDLMDENYRALRETAEAVPAHLREVQPPDGGWSVAQVIGHIALVESGLAQRVEQALSAPREQGLAEETDATPLAVDADFGRVADRSSRRQAPERAHPPADTRYADAWQSLDAAHAAVRSAFAAGEGLALAAVEMPHPALGSMNLYQWGVAVAGHQARHAAQIHETAASLAAA